MIDMLISIIDRIIQLKEYRNRQQKVLFNELIEPIFNDLLIIHSDYLSMFTEIEKFISASPIYNSYSPGSREYTEQVIKAADYLRKKRIEFEPVRTKLRTLVDEIDAIELDESISKFVYAVRQYFPTGSLLRATSSSTELLDNLDYFSNREEIEISSECIKDVEISDLTHYLQLLIHVHQGNWSFVCENFASLKIASASRG